MLSSASPLTTAPDWQRENYQALLAEINGLKYLLRQQLAEGKAHGAAHEAPSQARHATLFSRCGQASAPPTPESASADKSVAPASFLLTRLCELFGLSLFDRQLILLCLAAELDPEAPVLYQELTSRTAPTLALALRLGEGHCAAIAPDAALRFFQLLEIKNDSPMLAQRSLALSEWLLFYLTAAPILDPCLIDCLQALEPQHPCPPSRIQQARELTRLREQSATGLVLAQLQSDDASEAAQLAALIAREEDRYIHTFNLYHLPASVEERLHFLQVIERELIARQSLLLLDCQRLFADGMTEAEKFALQAWVLRLVQHLPSVCILYAAKKINLPRASIYHCKLDGLATDEQAQLWHHHLSDFASAALSSATMRACVMAISAHYQFNAEQVRAVVSRVALELGSRPEAVDVETLQHKLWAHSRQQSRQHLQGLAQVIKPGQLDWDALILPEREKRTLQAIMSQARQRQKVYQQWGFAEQAPYGLGICALFAGASGTGKTMAARVLASLLNIDLYHVDLSTVIDKYIGETEKKLEKIFRAAETSGALLLFDEADALFGKRTNVREAKDRYANMGVSFLLQRMEAYAGISILTTNLRSAMDSAFTRRLRFIVQFPFPAEAERERIWRRMLPAAAPKADIDYRKLARLTLAGGAIRNIALQAAFIAAERELAIDMGHLREAVREEYLKSEKTLDESLVRDW